MTAPVRPTPRPVRRGVCTTCGTTEARLFLGGWFCKDHKPGTVAQHTGEVTR